MSNDVMMNGSEIAFNDTCLFGESTKTCIFDKTEYQPKENYETVATQFYLICDRAWLNALLTSITFLSQGIATVFSGVIMRRFGIRNPMIFMRAAIGLLYLGMAFANHIAIIIVVRALIMGMECLTFSVFLFVYVIEIIGPQHAK